MDNRAPASSSTVLKSAGRGGGGFRRRHTAPCGPELPALYSDPVYSGGVNNDVCEVVSSDVAWRSAGSALIQRHPSRRLLRLAR